MRLTALSGTQTSNFSVKHNETFGGRKRAPSKLPKKKKNTKSYVNPRSLAGGFAVFGTAFLPAMSKLMTGKLPFVKLPPEPFRGVSGWPENTNVFASISQNQNSPPSIRPWVPIMGQESYQDRLVREMATTKSMSQAHAQISDRGLKLPFYQTGYSTSSMDLPLQQKGDKIIPGECTIVLPKNKDPRGQYFLLVSGPGASTRNLEKTIRKQNPLLKPLQLRILENANSEEIEANTNLINSIVEKELAKKKANPHLNLPSPAVHIYSHGHGVAIPDGQTSNSEGDKKAFIALKDGLVSEQFFVKQAAKFPTEIQKNFFFESCNAGGFIKAKP